MWFFCAIITFLAWGVADLFYKRGSDSDETYSHLKTTIAVGVVMGVHATAYLFITGCGFHPIDLVRYLPVSTMYILSMTIGYFGLRYIELSVSSPVQNSSGAVSAILCMIFLSYRPSGVELLGIGIICVGVFALALVEKRLSNAELTPQSVDKKYTVSAIAIIFPLLYCLIDGLGTFADAIYLDELELMSESDALLAYEFMFFLCAVVLAVYVYGIKRERVRLPKERTRLCAAIFETAGQFFYVFAMSGKAVVAAPVIASYSILSVILSRIFLKEKLTKLQYFIVVIVMAGIALLGIAEGLAE